MYDITIETRYSEPHRIHRKGPYSEEDVKYVSEVRYPTVYVRTVYDLI